jgi:Amidohydrolase
MAVLAERRVPVFVHPVIPGHGGQPHALPGSVLEFPVETTRAVANLPYSGTLDRYPELRLILSHAGGTFRAAPRHRETSRDALMDKAGCVVDVVGQRLAAIEVDWDSSQAVHLYTAHDVIFAVQRELLAQRGYVPVHGLVWHDAAPPVDDLELEIDVRAYHRQVRLPLG